MLGGHARQDNWIPPMISGFIRLFPSVRSSLCPPTQLLHYRDLHTATFVCSEPNLGMKRMKSANEDEELQDTVPAHLGRIQDPCAAPPGAAAPLYLHQRASHRARGCKSSNTHIPLHTQLFQPLSDPLHPKTPPCLPLGSIPQPCLPRSARELCCSSPCV